MCGVLPCVRLTLSTYSIHRVSDLLPVMDKVHLVFHTDIPTHLLIADAVCVDEYTYSHMKSLIIKTIQSNLKPITPTASQN